MNFMEIKKIINHQDKILYSKVASEVGTIFNTTDWLDIFGNKLQLFGIFEGEQLIGGFSLCREQRLGLMIYRNPPFTPCTGPFLKIESKNLVSIMNKQKEAINLIAKTIDRLPCSIVSISLNRDVVDTQPFIWKKFKVSPAYTYILNLEKSLEDIQKEMSSKRRHDINKAVRDGLIVQKTKNFHIINDLVQKTFLRQDKKLKESYYLNKILFGFANDKNSFAFITMKNKKSIAGAFCVHDKNTAYYLLGGYDSESRHHGAGALALWEAIKHSQALGLKYFDFEGSMVPQIEKYFRGFGGRLTPYYRVNKAKLPLEIILKFFKRELF